ncbi:MAG: hypothetical protein QF789_05755 [Gammaproteobacteria bacterium]|jgi:hypothetical protein|nr:hypothetical protein [Chromatiales bacterium]MCP4924747.1 hypothetical protein [Gammaproteobacteria bacterium]MDP7153272.1 hypothetical protein [Gammaproteobacteria bacterium]MDP7297171.1 hypothetical protein [Gammaproteobacteria bacterium]MDP7660715.1 hypothetical protein [Gammaproteobacteria bacterium]
MKKIKLFLIGVCTVIGMVTVGASSAEPVTYSGLAAFIDALPTEPSILDFDLMPTGMTIEDSESAGGITFKYDFDGLPMKVAHLYATTSAPNFLGTGDSGMFHDGDNFILSFPPGHGIGLFFISADPLLDGDISVTAGSVTAELIAENIHATLADGSRVYFVGIIDAQTAMTSAYIEALEGGFFLYNVDDIITAPLSETLAADSDPDKPLQIAVKL